MDLKGKGKEDMIRIKMLGTQFGSRCLPNQRIFGLHNRGYFLGYMRNYRPVYKDYGQPSLSVVSNLGS